VKLKVTDRNKDADLMSYWSV